VLTEATLIQQAPEIESQNPHVPETSSEKGSLLQDRETIPMSQMSQLEIKEQDAQLEDSPPRGSNLYLGIFIGMALAVGATQLLPFMQATSNATATVEETATIAKAPAQAVTVAPVEISSIMGTEDATGTVAALELIPVLSQANGLQIKEILVEEGDVVRQGQLLARLDDSALQARLARAKARVAESSANLAELKAGTRMEEIQRAKARLAQDKARLQESEASIPRQIDQAEARVRAAQARLNLARSRYVSNQKLVEEGAIAQDQFDAVVSEYSSAEANLLEAQEALRQAKNTNPPEMARLTATVIEAQQELAQLQAGPRPEEIARAAARLAQDEADLDLAIAELKHTLIVAPRSGKIATRNARVGNVTSGNERLFEIIENGRLELLLKVTEAQLRQVFPGQRVEITSDADKELKLEGRVKEILPLVEEESRQGTVKVDLPTTKSLRPGMFLRGKIVVSSNPGLSVPATAILPQTNGSAIVYLLQGEKAIEQEVVLGELLPGDQVEIKSGLKTGDRVVVKGAAFLKDGDLVSIVKE